MTSFSIILNKKDDIPSDANMIQYSNFVYEQLGKPRGANISKDEFSGWIKSEFLDSQKFTVELLHASISERISTLPEKALTDGRPKTANA